MQTNILIVDDMPHNLEVVSRLLEVDGFTTFKARGGQEALDLLAKEEIDLVLLDVRMPDMDGFEVCERLKQRPGLGNIPVIFLTGMGDRASVIRGFEVGGSDYVTKPFDVEELRARVITHLKIRRLQQRLMEQNQRLAEALHARFRMDQELRQNGGFMALCSAGLAAKRADRSADEEWLVALQHWLGGTAVSVVLGSGEGAELVFRRGGEWSPTTLPWADIGEQGHMALLRSPEGECRLYLPLPCEAERLTLVVDMGQGECRIGEELSHSLELMADMAADVVGRIQAPE